MNFADQVDLFRLRLFASAVKDWQYVVAEWSYASDSETMATFVPPSRPERVDFEYPKFFAHVNRIFVTPPVDQAKLPPFTPHPLPDALEHFVVHPDAGASGIVFRLPAGCWSVMPVAFRFPVGRDLWFPTKISGAEAMHLSGRLYSQIETEGWSRSSYHADMSVWLKMSGEIVDGEKFIYRRTIDETMRRGNTFVSRGI